MTPDTQECVAVTRSNRPFQWRTNGGTFISPAEMDTPHLYFTLRMIWNHVAPEELRLYPYRQYKFGPYYTTEYTREAVAHLGAELLTRKDIREEWLVPTRRMLIAGPSEGRGNDTD